MVQWFWWDLDDQLISLSAVALVICPVKVVHKMTYNVLSGTLSLYAATNITTTATLEPHFNAPQ